MRFLIEPTTHRDLEAITTTARAAHAAGLDGILLRQTSTQPAPLITAAALAPRVPDLLLATELEIGDRHPFELAEEFAVVDLAAAGRLVLVARPAPGTEDDYGEALDLIRTALSPRPFRFEGRRWTVPAGLPQNVFELEAEVRLTPSPAQVRPEIWGAGSGCDEALVRGLGYLAEADDDPEELAAAYDRATTKIGPAAIGAPRARRDTLTEPGELVHRLRDGRTTFGQDWAVISGGADEAHMVGTRVRPRVMLERLNPGVEQLWEAATR